MGASCCEAKNPELEKLAIDQKRVLWIALVINFIMFGTELVSGIYANSTALLGDSLDMLGDSFAYGVSLYVVGLSSLAKARSAIFKGWIILASAVSILAATIYRTIFQEVPIFETMGVVGILALAANLTCLILLTRHRNTDVNMASVWLCSRNDIIANVSVLAAAGLVMLTASPWPDLVVGIALTLLFFKSALHIFAESRKSLNGKSAWSGL